jgi:chromosome segregation ATPase
MEQPAANLDRLADDLADQRLELVEHWQRAAETQQRWQEARAAAAAELEVLAASFPKREQELLLRREALEAAESNLRDRQLELSRFRQHLEGWAARVRLRESTWEGERDRFLIDLSGREEIADKHLKALIDLRERWVKRRRQELARLRGERGTCEKLRQQFATLRQDYWKRCLSLEQQQRELSEKMLALEEYRQRVVLQAPDAAAVESRLERLRKRWVQQNAAVMRATADQFEHLQAEAAQVQQRGRELLKVAEELTHREATLVQRQTAWEETLTRSELEEDRLRQHLHSAQSQRERSQRQIADLQSEVERLARVLLDEIDAPEGLPAQAA